MALAYMRLFLSKFLILSLLLVTMHSALANEFTPLPVDNYMTTQQVLGQQVQDTENVFVSDGQLPSGEHITSSECNVCHTAHILLILAPGQLSLDNYASSIKNMGGNTPPRAPVEDIPNPPIILI
ncbi:MAG: hypothetical protein COA91_06760 [Robiginitomaculum sp.]|nr:MAG: hypothetical protein COA91_06760 [Robiginitomaculum sp.]